MKYTQDQLNIIRHKKSLWVEASAGSGKTLVLINRVLFLLANGTDPNSILCITFSNNASKEILSRLQKELFAWAKDSNLLTTLECILGYKPSESILYDMQNIYKKLSCLTICTIHSLCKNIISNFTFELGLGKNFKVIDNYKLDDILEYIDDKESIKLFVQSVGNLTKITYELNEMIIGNKSLNQIKNFGDLLFKLKFYDNLSEDLKNDLIPIMDSSLIDGIKFLDTYLLNRKKFDNAKLLNILEQNYNGHLKNAIQNYINNSNFSNYKQIFLTKFNQARKVFSYFSDENPLKSEINQEIYYIVEVVSLIYQIKLSAIYNAAFLAINNAYLKYKKFNNMLDYHDMINYTLHLFSDKFDQNWINYRLNYNFQYVLIDEAQDTNYDQWQILKKITKNFTSSLMVVGDTKQSIYYFQGTEPGIFDKQYSEIQDLISIDLFHLNKSFRTNKTILNFIDKVCQRLSWNNVKHIAEYDHRDGKVEFLNIIRSLEDSDFCLDDIIVDTIAKKVSNILNSNITLPSQNNAIVQPKHIMILLRKASGLDQKIANKLKKYYKINAVLNNRNLSNNIIINDLLALGKFFICPHDDLNLATILKGPLFNLNNQDLIPICQNRDGSLWSKIIIDYPDYCNKLKIIFDMFQGNIKIMPYYFFTRVFNYFQDDFFKIFKNQMCIIDQFWNSCINYTNDNSESNLEEFILNFNNLKENNFVNNDNAVRITSIHQAKGLQSPIVILADFFRINDISTKRNYLFINKANLFIHKSYNKNILLQDHNMIELNESDRLLYVAMTRAEDYLIMLNIENIDKSNNYAQIVKNIIDHDNQDDVENVFTIEQQRKWKHESYILKLENYKKILSNNNLELNDTRFLNNNIHFNKYSLGNLECSTENNIKNNDIILSNEITKGNVIKIAHHHIPNYSYGIVLGNIVHKVLELTLEKKDHFYQEKLIKKLLEQNFGNSNYYEQIASSINNFSQNSTLIDLFKDSYAEISLCGMIDQKYTICRLDRLKIEDNKVIIMDFKTDINVPDNIKNIPEKYKKQMKLYTKLLKQKYPDKEIQIIIGWISNGTIMLL